MFKKIRLFLIILNIAICSLYSNNIKAVYIGNTLDESIGGSAVYDIIKIRDLIKKASNHTGLKLEETILVHDLFDPELFMNALNNLNSTPDDVIFIYYTGHGHHYGSDYSSPWPAFYFHKYTVKFEQIAEKLSEMPARLKIFISDCCNINIPEEYLPPLYMPNKVFAKNSTVQTETQNYLNLFVHSHGTIYATSSSPTEYSYAYYNGALFTGFLTKVLETNIKKTDNLSWQQVFEAAKAKTVDFAMKENLNQTPYYEINIK